MNRMSLKTNFSWTLVGNLIYALCQWGIIASFAKFGSPEIVGRFSYALALTSPVFLFTSLKLRSAQATDQKHEYQFGDYLATRLLTSVLAFICIVLLAVYICDDSDLVFIVILIGAMKGIESFSDIIYGLFQQEERMDCISKSLMIRGIISFFAVMILVVQDKSLLVVLAAMFAVWTGVLVCYDVPKARTLLRGRRKNETLRPVWDEARIKALVVLTLPLGGAVALGSLYTNLPRYFIKHQLGVYDLGIFSALAYFMLAGNTVINALGQSASPRLARLHAEKKHQAFRRLLTKIVAIGFVLGCCGVLVAFFFGDSLLELFYSSEYAAHSDIFLLLMIAAGVQYTYIFLGSAINAMRLFRVQVLVSLLSVVILGICCYLFAGPFGLTGVVIAMIVVKILEATVYLLLLLKFIGKNACGVEI
ncbi:lipopolysaccharide biosynthesis protein [Geothermobacter hydrogeniphilus]|uniref:Membrane protein involved in the export of O-antigen and teichoic acid n=1 Tax=Geothermobacter hydrogeniphilus TaxID=1969733 RepID=A0A1X0XSI5_9BACT|nr:oligosaccharide flippase family protein [Geothermobacter hydrogeniphilus]ORJ55883.1 hypothetical protein B5V00_14910 [Geothermobacter hydrogeniphilus]